MSRTTEYLVADVGGTNTRVALTRGAIVRKETIRRYANAEFGDLGAVLRTFMNEAAPEQTPHGVCVAIAGPVRNHTGRLTNRDWTVNREGLRKATGATLIAVVNDLQAQGHAIGYTEPDSDLVVIDGPREGGATRLMIGIGTGFNAAPVYETGAVRLVCPSEAGHPGLPAGNDDEARLACFIERTHGFPSIEEVLSGRGIGHIHDWLSEEAGKPRLPANEVLAAAGSADPLARAAVAMFVRVMGNVAGNLALTYLPFGGIHLVGGVSRRFEPWFAEMGFTDAFRAKGRFSGFMEQFRVTLSTDDFAALTGCAAYLAALDAQG